MSVNKLQEKFIKEISNQIAGNKSSEQVPFIKYPKEHVYTERPDVENFYLKPVIICIPHKQFPRISILCPVCRQNFKPLCWPTNPIARSIHGLRQSLYILQYRYGCQCGTSDSLTVIKNMPSYCQTMYAFGMITHKSAIENDLLVYITSDATTGHRISY